MKKQYMVPETEVLNYEAEGQFLASADNLTKNTTYSSNYSESEFWD